MIEIKTFQAKVGSLFNSHFDKFALKCVLQINLNSVVSRHFCF